MNWVYCAASCSVNANIELLLLEELGKKDLLYAAETTSSGSEGTCEHVTAADAGFGVRRRIQIGLNILLFRLFHSSPALLHNN